MAQTKTPVQPQAEYNQFKALFYGSILILILMILVAEVFIVYHKFFVYEPPFKVGRYPPGYTPPQDL